MGITIKEVDISLTLTPREAELFDKMFQEYTRNMLVSICEDVKNGIDVSSGRNLHEEYTKLIEKFVKGTMMVDQELVRGSLWKCLNPDGLEFDQDGIYTMHRDDDDTYYLEDNTGYKRYLGESFEWPLEEFHEMFMRVV